MQFVCRNCGAVCFDVDQVLEGNCSCGSTQFQLVSQQRAPMPTAMTTKEEIRRDLHRWIDLNIDSMDPKAVGNIRVVFELAKD